MNSITDNESGLALLMTVFVIALATILVIDFSSETLRYQKQCRMFQERVQADLMLKSALGLAQTLIELPKVPGVNEDSFLDPWHSIAADPNLIIPGLIGEPKIAIVDESSKINVNAILSTGAAGGLNYWRDALRDLFLNHIGMADEDYPPEEARTLGNKGFNANNQVAAIQDWIDPDQNSLNDPGFEGQGIETQADKKWFFNRQLANISELALIPGMTLERLARISSFVRTSYVNNAKININTASSEVLQSIGFDPTLTGEIMQRRLQDPYTLDELNLLLSTSGSANLRNMTTVSSQEFSAYIKITMPNVTRWARAIFDAQGQPSSRKTYRRYLEIM